MSVRTKWIVFVVLVVLAALIFLVSRLDCNGNEPPPARRKAQAYICEETSQKFGVPLEAKVYPPIQNPTTGKRTLVRAHVHVPKGGGEPKALWYSKFTDQQIKFMEDYARKARPEELENNSPEGELASQNEGPLIKRPGGRWITYQERLENPELDPSVRKEAQDYREIFPDDWGEILEEDRIKQWLPVGGRSGRDFDD